MQPTTLYVALNFLAALSFSLIFTVNQIYYVTEVGMAPLQLVLTGTIVETSVFLFEIPTGVLADVKSRRLSIILGYCIMGFGFFLEGTLPFFWSVALAQVLWGLGYTFTSGASEAWIADEAGEANAGEAYLRGAQWANVGSMVAIPASVLLGSRRINLPILAGGVGLMGIGCTLALVMREEGFSPLAAGERSSWRQMGDTLQGARSVVRRQPILLSLLGIGFFYGFYSEGLDRLWTPHLIQNFRFPSQPALSAVTWFGIVRGFRLLLGVLGTAVVRRRLDLQRAHHIGRLSRLNSGLIIAALLGFALTRSFLLALVLFWLVGVLRSVQAPLHTAWVNMKVDDPQVRATLLSVSSQTDAIGQITGGPVIGVVGNLSIRAALASSALLLAPVLPLYTRALRRERVAMEPADAA